MLIRMLILSAALLGWSGVVRAQVGACPPGTIPNGTQSNMTQCAPDPSYQQQPQQPIQPSPVWSDRWGAIASGDSAAPAFGAVTGLRSKRAAQAAAIAKCQGQNGPKCSIFTTYRNQCVAVVTGNNVAISAGAATLDEATQLAMNKCKSKDSECHVYYTGCSYPVRVR